MSTWRGRRSSRAATARRPSGTSLGCTHTGCGRRCSGTDAVKGVQPRVKRTRGGEFLLKLPPVERDVLRSLPAQLRQLLGTDDPALERLFPPAYRDDPLAQADYEEMVHGDL